MAGLVALDGGDGAGTELAVGGEPLALGVELLLHQPDAAARAAAPQHDAGVGDGEAVFGRIFQNFALKLVSVSLGAIIYYIVIQLVLTLGFDANLLKLLSASVVAIFLAVPYWKSRYFAKPTAKKKEGAKNA